MTETSQTQPPELSVAPPVLEQGDATGGVIPYKTPHAITAYYLGIFSIIPILGFILGAVALALGISGLRQRKKRPIIRGAVHAWIGIVCGGLSVLVHILVVALIVINVVRHG